MDISVNFKQYNQHKSSKIEARVCWPPIACLQISNSQLMLEGWTKGWRFTNRIHPLVITKMRQHFSAGMSGLCAELFHECIEPDGVISADIRVGQLWYVRVED